MEKYHCTHCGHRFEGKPAETVVCPHCFWSTSVEKEGEKKIAADARPPAPKSASPQKELTGDPQRLKIGVGIFILTIGLAVFFAVQYLQKHDKIIQQIETENQQKIAAEAPELALTPEEQQILANDVKLEERPLNESEKEILASRMTLRSSPTEGISTPPWDEAQFKQFLKETQGKYKIPLGWSYEKDLNRLFKSHYPAAAAAFEAKDYLKARDEWARALAFPVYKGDVRRHRGVVLTMLRPYINDVLSKIGQMNAALVGKEVFAQEAEIRKSYESLFKSLEEESWEEADAQIQELLQKIEIAQAPQAPVAPPPLPAEINAVDFDIQQILLSQTDAVESSRPDWRALHEDLKAKARIVQMHAPAAIEKFQLLYDEAFNEIERGNLERAKELLKKNEFPEPLGSDVQAKLKILDKLLGGSKTVAASETCR